MSHNPAWLINPYPNDLKNQIRALVEKGYVVTLQDKESAQLIRKKGYSCLISFLLGIIPYTLYYMWKRDEMVYLDLSTQVLDPNWAEKERKKWMTDRVLLVVTGLAIFIFFIVVVVLSD